MSEPSFNALLSGELDTPAIITFLEGLNARGITSGDLVMLAQALRTHALPFPPQPDALDVCGTGGDGLDTPNISTAVALVLAGCGVKVAKHGNRAATGRCGSADVLEALGVKLEVSAATAERALRETNLCFLFARHYHPAMRHVTAARQQIGKRTIFNLVGPLANPAHPTRQIVGVFDRAWLRPMAEALHALGCHSAWVVHSRDGMDEISTLAPTDVLMLHRGVFRETVIDPAAYGLQLHDPSELQGGDIATNAALLQDLLNGTSGALQDIVILNAAAALVMAEQAATVEAGITQARQALTSGIAKKMLEKFVTLSKN